MFDLKSAAQEISKKTDSTIQIETALKWGARAVVCYRLYKKTKKLKWLQRAEDYRHEAIEHASLADDGFETLKKVSAALAAEAQLAVSE